MAGVVLFTGVASALLLVVRGSGGEDGSRCAGGDLGSYSDPVAGVHEGDPIEFCVRSEGGQFTTLLLAGLGDFTLELLDHRRERVAFADDTFGLNPEIRLDELEAGDYVVVVDAHELAGGPYSLDYELMVGSTSPVAGREPGAIELVAPALCEELAILRPGSAVEGHIAERTRSARVCLVVTERRRHQINVLDPVHDTELSIRVTDRNGEVVDYRATPVGIGVTFVDPVLDEGIYVVEVSPYQVDAAADYEISVYAQ